MMPRYEPLVAFDFSGLDHLNIGNGQFRYCIDLIRGLAQRSRSLRFVVAGSRAEPVAEIRHVFDGAAWRYAHLPRARFKGGAYVDHIRFALWLRRERVDLLHAPHMFLPLLSATPALVTVYDMMSEIFPEYRPRVISRPYQRFKHAVQNQRPLLIAISRTTADDLHRLWGIPSSRIRVVHLGVDPVMPAPNPGARVNQVTDTTFILSPFNLEPRKNLRALLLAAAVVRKRYPDVRVVLYGRAAVTSEREEQFHRDTREIGIEESVIPVGFLSDQDLASLLRHAAIFVFPSLYEGFGLPVLEAMAAGTCVVARNQSAMAEILGDTGVQIETREPAVLAEAISSLLDDPARRVALGRAAKSRAAQFSIDAMVEGTLAAYKEALERG